MNTWPLGSMLHHGGLALPGWPQHTEDVTFVDVRGHGVAASLEAQKHILLAKGGCVLEPVCFQHCTAVSTNNGGGRV